VATFTSSSSCLPLSQCSSVLFSSREFSASSCSLSDGSAGSVCSHRTFQASSRRPFRSAETSTFIGTRNSAGSIDLALRSGQSAVRNMTRFSTSQFASPRRGTGTFYHARFQRQSRPQVLARVGRAGLLAAQAALQLSRSEVSTRRGGGNALNGGAVNFGASTSSRQVLSTGTSSSCGAPNSCSGSGLYRRADGSCNNLRETRFGQADTPLNRILLPDYADGVSAPRVSSSGRELPSARFVSTRLTRDLDNPDQRSTLLVMSFGQFVDHDITHSPILKNGAGNDIDCCSSTAGTDFESFCAPIDVPNNDPFFGGRKSCMNLVRSTPAPALDCSVRYREQVNQLTHWLDTSQVYGSNIGEQRSLRTFRGGRLRAEQGPDGALLPSDNGDESCTGACFKAGDSRVNEQPNLSVLHTIFLREHNRVASQLQQRNQAWSDERVFQEAKRFVNAEYQHIVYNEWLPVVLGKQFINTYGLFPLASGYSQDYDTSFDPRITNEFATAAFRFGHSLIPHIINVYNTVGGELNPSFDLKQAFNKPQLLRLPGMLDGLVAGLTRDNSQRFDSGFVDDIRNHLFNGGQRGLDLIALNIQRGREHGIAGYNQYREICGLGRAQTFSQLSRQMSVQRTQELAATYDSVDDIDLFIGLVSERPRQGALVGPTTLCIVGDQFARLKKGDRYFYEVGGQEGSLTPEQLAEVRKSSMARILCDNSGVSQMQPLAFQTPSGVNQVVGCNNLGPIPRPSLERWGSRGG